MSNTLDVSKQNLRKIKELALGYYRDDHNSNLSADENLAKAWSKAVMAVLAPEVDLEFTKRNVGTSVFED